MASSSSSVSSDFSQLALLNALADAAATSPRHSPQSSTNSLSPRRVVLSPPLAGSSASSAAAGLPTPISSTAASLAVNAFQSVIKTLREKESAKQRSLFSNEKAVKEAERELSDAQQKVETCRQQVLQSRSELSQIQQDILNLQQYQNTLGGSLSSSSSSSSVLAPIALAADNEQEEMPAPLATPAKRSRGPETTLAGPPAKRNTPTGSSSKASSSSSSSLPKFQILADIFQPGSTVYHNGSPVQILKVNQQDENFTIRQEIGEMIVPRAELVYVPKVGEHCLLRDWRGDQLGKYYQVKIVSILKSPKPQKIKGVVIEVEWIGFDTIEQRQVRFLDSLLPISGNDSILEKLESLKVADKQGKEGMAYYLSYKTAD